jgi:hypothetical protein
LENRPVREEGALDGKGEHAECFVTHQN